MKTYSSKTRESYRRNSRKRTLFKVCIGAVIGMLLIWGVGASIGSVVSMVVSPVFSIQSWFINSTATVPSYFKSRNTLLSEMSELEQRLAAQSGSRAVIDYLTQENESLRSLLGSEKAPRTAARIIAFPPAMPFDQILIDQGSTDGIKKGAFVYAADNHVFGFVAAVYPYSSLVRLFSSPGVKASVYVYGPDIYTEAQGAGGGVIKITVPQGIVIEEGDTVVLPAGDPSILGTISSIVSVPTEPEQRAYVTPAVSLYEMTHVAVSSQVLETVSFKEARERVDTTIETFLKVDVPADILIEVGTTTSSTIPTASSTTTNDVDN